jgi:hypothetical protein
MPVILATQKAEIRRITVQSQSLANSSQNPISKKTRADGVAQGVDPRASPSNAKTSKKTLKAAFKPPCSSFSSLGDQHFSRESLTVTQAIHCFPSELESNIFSSLITGCKIILLWPS